MQTFLITGGQIYAFQGIKTRKEGDVGLGGG